MRFRYANYLKPHPSLARLVPPSPRGKGKILPRSHFILHFAFCILHWRFAPCAPSAPLTNFPFSIFHWQSPAFRLYSTCTNLQQKIMQVYKSVENPLTHSLFCGTMITSKGSSSSPHGVVRSIVKTANSSARCLLNLFR